MQWDVVGWIVEASEEDFVVVSCWKIHEQRQPQLQICRGSRHWHWEQDGSRPQISQRPRKEASDSEVGTGSAFPLGLEERENGRASRPL